MLQAEGPQAQGAPRGGVKEAPGYWLGRPRPRRSARPAVGGGGDRDPHGGVLGPHLRQRPGVPAGALADRQRSGLPQAQEVRQPPLGDVHRGRRHQARVPRRLRPSADPQGGLPSDLVEVPRQGAGQEEHGEATPPPGERDEAEDDESRGVPAHAESPAARPARGRQAVHGAERRQREVSLRSASSVSRRSKPPRTSLARRIYQARRQMRRGPGIPQGPRVT
mmetsp:Transcript_49722/g.100146  ORF Transcript_49722/g.100146 Transcript_49722/m.100146 type:complete len:222 (+) Transcript_49722:3-668(+)